MIIDRKNEALLGPLHMQVYMCVYSWSCLFSICMFASLVSVRERVLFVLALWTGTVEVLVGSYDSALQH